MDELDRLISKLEWRQKRGFSKLLLIGRRLYRNLRFVFFDWRANRTLAVIAAQTHGVPRRRQFFRFATLALKRGYSPEDYYRFRMYATPEQAPYFLSLRKNIILRTYLYDALGLDPAPLADKRLFYRRCKNADLPVPETLVDFSQGKEQWWSQPGLPACDLFLKEAVGLCGAGAAQWLWVGAGYWTEKTHGKLNEAELINELKAGSHTAAIMLQRRLTNHTELADLASSGLCTVRIVTMRAPEEKRPEILLAVFRIPTSDAVVDNFAQGGLACAVDLSSGVLRVAVRKKQSLAHMNITHHPDTKALILNRQIPMWDDVLQLALRAHHEFSAFPSVGWDIAVTPSGPVLIEGNYNWDVLLAQQPGWRPLGATRFVSHLRSWIRSASLPAASR
jgi:hypothetical protein